MSSGPSEEGGVEPAFVGLCECGSGRIRAQCHGRAEYEQMITRGADLARFQAELHWAMDAERQKHQGLGRPIQSLMLPDGRRVVFVGTRRFAGRWKTFPDFLMTYIADRFESAWGNAELAKPPAERHPLLNWYQEVCAVQARGTVDATGLRQSPVTDVVWRYLGLANDLYCIEHNADTPPVWERLLTRLRTPDGFLQAAFEVLAAGAFARAGFALHFEDDTDSSRKHVEFIATHPVTKRRFAVECKRRRDLEGGGKLRVISHLNRALEQNQTGLPLIAFIELDRPTDPAMPVVELLEGVKLLEEWANDPRSAAKAPAYIVLTNQPAPSTPDSTPTMVGYLHGFKIPELRFREVGPLSELVDAREAHPELHDLMDSMRKHSHIPNTFDGREAHAGPGMLTPLLRFHLQHLPP